MSCGKYSEKKGVVGRKYGMEKTAEEKKDMPKFTEQDRPEKVKEIYKALKRDHPGMPAELLPHADNALTAVPAHHSGWQ